MKRKIYFAVMITLVLIYSVPMDAQYKIVNYTDMNQINSLTEDGDFIWMCTSGGAFKRKKSDGSLVKVMNTDNSGISRNAVNTMFIDFFGNYWFGTNNGGISKYDGNSWTTYKNVAGMTVYSCVAITSDLNGDLWFGVNGGVLRLRNNKWDYFPLSTYFNVADILADDLGNIWASIAGKNANNCGLWEISSSDVVTRISGPNNYFSRISGPYCLLKDNNNSVWMGGYGDSSLIKYNNSNGAWTVYSGHSTIHSMAHDNLGNIWLGTEGGIMKYNGSTFSGPVSSGRSGFNPDLVMDVLVDSQGKVWLGSYIGLAQFNEGTNSWTPPILLNSLPSNYAETVVIDSNNKAWIYGQFDHTISYDGSVWNAVANNSSDSFWWMKKSAIDNANNKYVSMPGGDTKLRIFKLNPSNNTTSYTISGNLSYTWSNEVVQDLKYDKDNGKIWIATTNGLFWFKISNNTFGQFTYSAGGLRSNSVVGLAINGSKVWYSTSDNGIGYYDESNSTWHGYSTAEGLPATYAGEIAFDLSNNLWIISSNIVKYDGSTFTNIPFPDGTYPTHIAFDLTGNMWLGGYGALVKYRDGLFRKYTTDDGLIDNSISNIIVDALNNVWVPTGYYGISKLVPQTPVADFSSNTACLPGSTVLTNLSTLTDDLTTFEWDINNDGSIESTSRDFETVFPNKGTFDVKLTVKNDNLSSEVIKQVHVLEAPNLSLSIEGDHSICFGGSQNLQVIINNPDPLLTYQVDWNNGIQGTQEIWASQAGEYYATVNNGQCESQSPSMNLAISNPFEEEKICMVTVDVATGKNMIIWERSHGVGIESYNVYKLFGNTYVPIGNVSALDISQYIDYGSTPDALAARYAISSIDTCGNESAKSAYHQTIQLGASVGIQPNTVVLDWTNYIDESKIWQPAWYFIYRGNDPSKLALIDSVSSVFTEWNDLDPGDNRYYQVMVNKSSPCDPAEILGKKTSSGPYVHSLSNLEDNRLQGTGINGANSENSLSIYPNPFNVEATISWPNADNSEYTLKLYDLRGSLVKEVSNLRGSDYKLYRENIGQGIYLLEISGEKLFKSTIIIQ